MRLKGKVALVTGASRGKAGPHAALRGGTATARRVLLGAGSLALERLSLRLVARPLGCRRPPLRTLGAWPLGVDWLSLGLATGTLAVAQLSSNAMGT